ncbi:MAG: hypothetical protein MJ223_02400 [Mycoplasmoidaceae bacterium]|nr:hypothetical protein [Mycoplasmoidaceae bacterium]
MIKIRKLSCIEKRRTNAGSFYAIALGIDILVSTISSLVMNSVSMAKGQTQTSSDVNYGYRRTTVMRLSPVPSRSSISIIG